jgi:hypothetical protein
MTSVLPEEDLAAARAGAETPLASSRAEATAVGVPDQEEPQMAGKTIPLGTARPHSPRETEAGE